MTIPQFQVCICSCECSVVGVINYCFDLLSFFFSLQNFHKQFKEMAAVMETV